MQNHASSSKKIIFNAVIFIALIAVGIGGYSYFMNNKPTVKKKKTVQKTTTVDVMRLSKEDITMEITGTGTVVPARSITLKAKISGTVDWISPQFAEGGIIRKGEEVLRIDPTDYKLALKKSLSTLENAKAALMIEQGQQRVAEEGARLLAQEKNSKRYSTELALRKPQLMQAKATVATAQADVEQDKLNISRCVIRAPFDVMVQSTSVTLGSQITSSTELASLVGTEEYWVETAVPLDSLEHIGFSRKNIVAKIVRQGGSSAWQGKVVRLKGSLTESTRLARVIVSVSDPQKLNEKTFSMPLMLGDYVNVTITGNTLNATYKIPRSAVHNEKELWVYDEGKLTVIPIIPLWKTADYVYADNSLGEHHAVITSHLSNAYAGMSVSLKNSAVAAPEKKQQKQLPHTGNQSVTSNKRVASAE